MKTLTQEEFKKMYGADAIKAFDAPTQDNSGLFDTIKADLAKRGQENLNILEQSKKDTSLGGNIAGGFKLAANTAGGVGDVIGNTLNKIPGVKPVTEAIGKGFNAVTDKLAGTKFFQEASQGLQPGNALEKGLSVAQSGGEIAGNILATDVGVRGAAKTGEVAAQVPSKIAEAIPKPPPGGSGGLGEVGTYLKGAIKDVTPTVQNTIDHQIAKALDLTPGDLSNIEASTGNQVGRWLADNNLIGTNKVTTQAAIDDFFKQNYAAVRSEIGKVTQTYKPSQIPRYTDALKAIQIQIKDTLGLEKVNAEIDNLLRKTSVTLNDVQRVKELMDDHFSLYKVTGDVASGVMKEGLANVRTGLKDFIEAQVMKYTKADIRALNNNVSTARSLSDAITTRSPRGLTRANITNRDIMTGLGLTYFGTPLLGLAYVFLKKLVTSPTVRLRIARYLDQLSDEQKAKISLQLQQGKVPADIQKIAAPLDTAEIPPSGI